jgi:hypothetical protein
VNASFGFLDNESHQHSYDVGAAYATLWFGTGADSGLQVDIGKWYTTIGAELMIAPDNWLISRTMLFGFGPFTHTGVLLRYYLDSQWNVHAGMSRGWDQVEDVNDGPSFHGGVAYTTSDEKHVIGFNMIAGPENPGQGHPGNRWIGNITWTTQWTERVTGVLDAAYTHQDDAPGAVTDTGGPSKRDSAWWGIAYMVNCDINEYMNATTRFEYFADNHGARTGFRGHFYSLTTGMAFTPFPEEQWLKELQIRPEVRWDLSDNNAPFHHDQQVTAAIDVIYKF